VQIKIKKRYNRRHLTSSSALTWYVTPCRSRLCLADYGQTWRHRQNRKYIGPNVLHCSQRTDPCNWHVQKIAWNLDARFLRCEQTDIQTCSSQYLAREVMTGSKNLWMCMRDGSVVIDRCHDVTGDRLQIGSITAVDVAVVDVDKRATVRTQVFIQHPQHVRQQFDQFAELKISS